jgi:hypothetical protein
MSEDDLRGRLVWNEDVEPYDVVVDGRRLTWDEFGRALEPFEGWEFRLSFRRKDVDPDDTQPEAEPSGVVLPSERTPDIYLH